MVAGLPEKWLPSFVSLNNSLIFCLSFLKSFFSFSPSPFFSLNRPLPLSFSTSFPSSLFSFRFLPFLSFLHSLFPFLPPALDPLSSSSSSVSLDLLLFPSLLPFFPLFSLTFPPPSPLSASFLPIFLKISQLNNHLPSPLSSLQSIIFPHCTPIHPFVVFFVFLLSILPLLFHSLYWIVFLPLLFFQPC